MAEAYKNKGLAVTSSYQTIYTTPSATSSVVVALRITNVDGATDDAVTVSVYDNSVTTAYEVASTLSVPADTTIELAGTTKLFLEADDYVQVKGVNASGDLVAFISVLEIS